MRGDETSDVEQWQKQGQRKIKEMRLGRTNGAEADVGQTKGI